jgi:eukaryotic-like serine/threonine-protein kinase
MVRHERVAAGEWVGPYEVVRELGRGGMATVYLAHDPGHNRHVALKLLHPHVREAVGPERFLREIRLAAPLRHPHILPLIDSGRVPAPAGGQARLYYVMPYVEGESLRARLRRGELPVMGAVHILREVAGALAYAHGEEVVHRDIKPDNVLLAGRHAMVADFGIAKAATAEGTTPGIVMGTPGYMAPEQATRTPEPVDRHCPTVPPALAALVMACLAKRPAERPQSAEEVVRELEAVITPRG